MFYAIESCHTERPASFIRQCYQSFNTREEVVIWLKSFGFSPVNDNEEKDELWRQKRGSSINYHWIRTA